MTVPNNITREHILSAIDRVDREGVPSGALSSTYDLVYKNNKYPPKLVVSWANMFANGDELDRKLFEGGEGTPCFKLIRSKGFEIVPKAGGAHSNESKEESYWFVGASYDHGSDDKTDEFVREGLWVSGFEDKHQDLVNRIKPGERIAIKSTYTRKKNLPFNANGNTVSVMGIKAIGVVAENVGDGRTLKVDWVKLPEKREWYFYTKRDTIWQQKLDSPFSEALIQFTFFDENQDYELFRNDPFWKERFGENGPTEAGESFYPILNQFLQQENNLKTAHYQKTYAALKMRVSFGKSQLSRIPWIALLHGEQVVQKGIYPVYLHYKDQNILILARGLSETKSPDLSWENTGVTIKQYFQDHYGIRPARYGDSFIYKLYDLNENIEESVIQQDLSSLLTEYKTLMDLTAPEPPAQPRRSKVASKDWLPSVCEIMANNGFHFNQADVANFYLSLRTKPFVILAGISGTGKTQIARQFAKAIGYGDERHCVLIPVRPDWSDNTDLVGYRNIQGVFEQQAMLRVLQDAMSNPDEPFFVILDEMNLARVEHYFSDFLSVMETREKDASGVICTDAIVNDDTVNDGMPVYIPENVMIVGTVNMDETTHPFSRKVLDRANALEMNTIDLAWAEPYGNTTAGAVEGIYADAFVTPYLNANKDLATEQKSALSDVVTLLIRINALLEPAGLHFGYRVRDEIAFYLTQHREMTLAGADIMSEKDALDYQLMQKVLPRIQGSSMAVLTAILALLKELTGANISNDMELGGVEAALEEGDVVSYRRSVKKLLFMLRRFHEDGFTSFWL